ncbi:DUF4357 domain-containing protein [Sedimenticola hydrogenitrophicus]|uniref:DUF4357 domain-containing protein n=1 Tax=Sedimenticola hydrogenitrophicus TaxID=2967975 RepID=UPI0021A8FAE4|nr:DUF4357 domain-containing protein [Sedimenticola hydrogenitrophicus]
MATIEVDFEVFKELTVRRTSESVTENDVIRGLLSLNQTVPVTPAGPQPVEAGRFPWVSKGVSFPSGTEFRATYKGQRHIGKVENGALIVNGERFTSPSAAAVSITGNPVNGWRFWECKLPGANRWKVIANLRKKSA